MGGELPLTESQYRGACDRISRGEPHEMDAAIRDVYERAGGTVSVWDAAQRHAVHAAPETGARLPSG